MAKRCEKCNKVYLDRYDKCPFCLRQTGSLQTGSLNKDSIFSRTNKTITSGTIRQINKSSDVLNKKYETSQSIKSNISSLHISDDYVPTRVG